MELTSQEVIMDFSEKWEILETLGEGGQGKVFRVIPKSMGSHLNRRLINIIKKIGKLPENYYDEENHDYEILKESILTIMKREDPSNYNALKVLHKPEDARDAELADERIRNEIMAMAEINHSNLLKIIEYDLDSKWFVSEYYSKGSISKNKNIFTGNVVTSLKAFRPLVEGVAALHSKNMVHRDIKPENVFIDQDYNLILGDFGLIFFMDDNKTRISKTLENVGSRDWMPHWAYGVRIEDVKPTFDVFCLGKLLWALISGQPKLLLWYYYKPQNNIEKLFPNAPFINLINPLFKKCIVENEENCLSDANALLIEIDKILELIRNKADRIDLNIERKCKVCGIGHYKLIVNENSTDVSNFGITPVGNRKWKIFTCSHCGNVQFFSFEGKLPNAWTTA